MPDPNIGETAAATWEELINPDGPTDNIFPSSAFFYSMVGGGQKGLKSGEGFSGKVGTPGGRLIEASVQYAVNTNFKFYGQFAQLDLVSVPVFDAARYPWKTAAGTVDWTDLEIAMNQEPAQKINLLDEKLANGKRSHEDNMNKAFLGVLPPAADNPLSIKDIISATPAVGVVGGIDAALWPFWRNKQTSGSAGADPPGSNLRAAMRSIYNQCSRGGLVEVPTATLGRRQEMELYESLLVPQERFTTADKDKNGQGAFNNDVLKFKNTEVFYDEDLDVPDFFMYTPKYLKIAFLRGYWMKMSDKLEPVNQLTYTQKIRTHCNLVTDQRRRLGRITDIS